MSQTNDESFETINRETVKKLMEDGAKLREEFDKRLRKMRTPSPEALQTRCK